MAGKEMIYKIGSNLSFTLRRAHCRNPPVCTLRLSAFKNIPFAARTVNSIQRSCLVSHDLRVPIKGGAVPQIGRGKSFMQQRIRCLEKEWTRGIFSEIRFAFRANFPNVRWKAEHLKCVAARALCMLVSRND